jgi:predicted metalloprotease with PDZ domain
MSHRLSVLLFLSAFLFSPCLAQTAPNAASETSQAAPGVIRLQLDATDAPRDILHGKLTVPVTPGPFTLVYPKWLPGEHAPTGPITDFTGLHIYAGTKELAWSRDDVEMFSFHIQVPAGINEIQVSFDQLLPPPGARFSSGATASSELAVISWNQVVLYPANTDSDKVMVSASLKVPQGWGIHTALPIAQSAAGETQFKTVSLTTLVDSPVQTGRYLRRIDLSPGQTPPHYLDIAADSEAALNVTPEDIEHFKRLVAETGALWGARHYNEYHFLLTLSDHVAHFGLEHHQSSDDRVGERTMIDPDMRFLSGSLLPHEMTHSWNGKYRRPAGLATRNYQDPMRDELLYVYEGLTQYFGNVLAARSGLWTPEQFRQEVAALAAHLDNRSGRSWRPLIDTTVAAQLLYAAPSEWENWRRSTDFYDEGFLIWLEADTIIRQKTGGKKSMNDFARFFEGPPNTPPKVVPYTFEDVVNTLNQVVPYDWAGFLKTRLHRTGDGAPLGGIENGGWKLAYTSKEPDLFSALEEKRKSLDARYSIGLLLDTDGNIIDVVMGSPAEKAGAAPGMKLVGVNNRAFTRDVFHDQLKATVEAKTPLQLLLRNGDYFVTLNLDYHGGERYPELQRNSAVPDLLSTIAAPLTQGAESSTAH